MKAQMDVKTSASNRQCCQQLVFILFTISFQTSFQ